jgi:hypothetical protein
VTGITYSDNIAVAATMAGTTGDIQGLQVRVTDVAGAPVAGQAVEWTLASPGSLNPLSASTTDSSGLATLAEAILDYGGPPEGCPDQMCIVQATAGPSSTSFSIPILVYEVPGQGFE